MPEVHIGDKYIMLLTKTAIIILNYNSWQETSKTINQFKDYLILDYIIVVDNCSIDNSFCELKKLESERVIVLSTDHNRGYAAGNNVGARFAIEKLHTDNIIISNPDIKCSEESIKEILKLLQSENTAITTGVIHNRDGNGRFKVFSAFGWRIPTYSDMISNCFLSIYKIKRSVFRNSIYYDYNILKQHSYVIVEAVSGCFFAIKASVLCEIGYFDENTFLYYEETILGYQLKQLGYQVKIATNASIYHCESVNKGNTISKRLITDKILLKSAKYYISCFLKRNKLSVLLYEMCFWMGKIETTILCMVFKRR